MFCRIFWIPGKGMGVSQNIQKFRVRVWKCYRTHRISGDCGASVQSSQTLRAGINYAVPVHQVLWRGAYKTHKCAGYGHECPIVLTEVPGTGMKGLQNFRKFRVLSHGRTDFAEVPGRYKIMYPYTGYCGTVTQILQNFRVRVSMSLQNSQKFFVRV